MSSVFSTGARLEIVKVLSQECIKRKTTNIDTGKVLEFYIIKALVRNIRTGYESVCIFKEKTREELYYVRKGYRFTR